MIIFLVILFLILLILVHELGHFLAAKFFKIKVEEFGIGFPPRIWGKKIGETLYSLNALPLGGFVKLFEENTGNDQRGFRGQPAGKRAAILLAGIIMNFLAGWLLISIVFSIGIPPGIAVTQVLDGSPAANAGFELNDFILKAASAGVAIEPKSPEEFVNFIKNSVGEKISFRIMRSGETITLEAETKNVFDENEGALGIAVTQKGIEKMSPPAALYDGLKTSASISYLIIAAIGNMLHDAISGQPVLENIVGPVGIFDLAIGAGHTGIIYLIQLIALISLNLAIINLIPLVPFDGGKLFLVLIEKIKGSALTFKTEQIAAVLGIAIILPLILLVIVRDIIRFF